MENREVPLTPRNVLERIYDDALGTFHPDDLGRTIRVAAVIDESCDSTLFRGIDHSVFVDSEEIGTSHALPVISDFADVGNGLTDFFAHVFDDHLVHGDVLFSVETPAVNGGSVELDELLSLLQLVETDGITLVTVNCKRLLLDVVDILDVGTIVDTGASRIRG